MNIFSLILIISSITYIYLGIYVIYLDKTSALNRLFLALSSSLFVWSFAAAFYISALDKKNCTLWYKISMFGSFFFMGFVLHFFLVYTHKENLLKKWWIYIILYLPSTIFSYVEITSDFYAKDYFHGSNGWIMSARTDSIWYWASNFHYMLYVILCLFLIYRWRKIVVSPRERRQFSVILISGALTFIVGTLILVYVTILDTNFPDVSSVAVMILSIGIFYAIGKYKLMVLTPTIAAENIFQTIIDSITLISPDGLILNANRETQRLLEYDQGELIGQPMEKLFPWDNRSEDTNIAGLRKKCPIRNMETFFVTKSGVSIPVLFSATECRDSEDTLLGFVLASKDITDLKDAENRLVQLAQHDALTHLPNRLLFNNRFSMAITRAQHDKMFIALLLLDLDRFKEINDIFGHSSGDLLLIEVADRLDGSVRESDTVARLGGDEFIVLLNDLKNIDDYEIAVQKILENIARPYLINMNEMNITTSIGISIFPTHGNDVENLMKNADLAMYSAKNQGRNSYQLFSPSMSTSNTEKMNLENSLRKVLSNNELRLFYQPVIDISTGMIMGVEALIRWKHPDYGEILPARFILLAEENGLIIPIGEWVLRTACSQAVIWQKAGYSPARISVNLSEKQFMQKNLIDIILGILNETGLDPKYLLLEITESTAIHDMESTIDKLNKLHDLGIMIIIDNFGNGYSSLIHLRKLPLYAIKIDRYFIRNIDSDPECAAIVAGIIAMAHNINLIVIAEGIENDKQLQCLRTLKWEFVGSPVCDGVQGFLFNSPVPCDKIGELFEKQKNGEVIW